MPALFALGDKVIANPALATFAAFGSFAMLLLVDFGGPLRERLQAQAALALVGFAFVTLGTLVSQSVWLSARHDGRSSASPCCSPVSSAPRWPARAPRCCLAFILPVTLAGPPSSIPDRLEGWAMASAAALVAVGAAVAHADARAAARSCDCSLQCARGETPCRGRLPARRRGRGAGPAARPRRCASRRRGRGAASRVPRHALPPGQPEHGRSRHRASRRRARLAQRDRRPGRAAHAGRGAQPAGLRGQARRGRRRSNAAPSCWRDGRRRRAAARGGGAAARRRRRTVERGATEYLPVRSHATAPPSATPSSFPHRVHQLA